MATKKKIGSQVGFPEKGCDEKEERIQKECEERERTSSRRAAHEELDQNGRTQESQGARAAQDRAQGHEEGRQEELRSA